MQSTVSKARSTALAVAGSIAGTLLVFLSILFMNQQAAAPEGEDGLVGALIKVERKEKPPSQRAVQQSRPKPKRTRASSAPAVGIDSGLAGLDFGLPQFETEDLGALAGSLLGDSGDATMTDDTVDNPPRPMVQNPMTYPVRAKAQGVTGYVVLSVLIGPTGAVERVKVIESQPAGVFDDTAVAGVQGWKFEPASYKGENVRVWATQKVSFNLG